MYRQRTLNYQSTTYNAATNTPPLADLVNGGIYNVVTEGKLTATTVTGAVVGTDSYLLAGDQVVNKNGTYELMNKEIKYSGATINFGAGGLFSTLYLALSYLKNRYYTSVTLNQLSATSETISVDFVNNCGGLITANFNNFLIDFSATAGRNLTLSANNVVVKDLNIKAATSASTSALLITGDIKYTGGITVENTTGSGIFNAGKLNVNGVTGVVIADTTAVIDITVGSIAAIAYQGSVKTCELSTYQLKSNGKVNLGGLTHIGVGGCNTGGADFSAGYNSINYILGDVLTLGGGFTGGFVATNYFGGDITTAGGNISFGNACANQTVAATAITTTGGNISGGAGCSNVLNGSIVTAGGDLACGFQTSNKIQATVTLAGGAFNGGRSCSNELGAAVNTGVGEFNCGNASKNYFAGTVAGTGLFHFGNAATNAFYSNVSGYTSISALHGSNNYTDPAITMPVGTPAVGTITAAFTRTS